MWLQYFPNSRLSHLSAKRWWCGNLSTVACMLIALAYCSLSWVAGIRLFRYAAPKRLSRGAKGDGRPYPSPGALGGPRYRREDGAQTWSV